MNRILLSIGFIGTLVCCQPAVDRVARGQIEGVKRELTEVERELLNALLTLQAEISRSVAEGQAHLEARLREVDARVVELERGATIMGLVDPCGDGPGYDEVLMLLSTGEVVAYFETGADRFLAVLYPNTYRTTDAQACQFTVTQGGVIIW